MGWARLDETAEEPTIEFRVADLSKPLPGFRRCFDLVVSNLVLDDMADYRGFARAMAQVLKPDGRLLLSLDNPYSAVVRDKVVNYFESGAEGPYRGLSAAGIDAPYHHRTLEDSIGAFRDSGFLLRTLVDVLPLDEPSPSESSARSMARRFPYFMILEFVRA